MGLMPRRLRQAPLVGRLAETSALDEVLRITAEGRASGPVAVVVAGDAGIGKSRVAAEISSRTAAAGWQVLSAGCLNLADGSVPYLPLVDALRAVTDDALPPVLAHWRRGETEPAAPELSPDVARGRVYAAYLELLRARSTEAPLALVVEDVHWSAGLERRPPTGVVHESGAVLPQVLGAMPNQPGNCHPR
jgi:predicted ATPase